MAEFGQPIQMDLGREDASPVIADGYINIDGEAHVLNFDTNILNLDENREVTPGADIERDGEDLPTLHSESLEEDPDVELSPGGILDEETIGRGLSNLGRSADGTMQVYLHCTIPGFNLIDITAIASYLHIQKVEIPYNQLTDLAPLSSLPYLLILDASHNKLTRVLDFEPPKNLKEADLSFNEIEEMSNLSDHHYLMKLNLDNNAISQISGLDQCKRLTNLSLAHNKINKIQGFDTLLIQFLNLCHNTIKKIENIETLHQLRHVNMSGNKIRSLKGLQDHNLLETIDLEDNEVIDITETKFIKELPMFRQLNLLRNPIQELPDYRLSILYQIQGLTELDRHKVEVDEKVASMNMFNPPAEVIASRDHIMHVVYSFLQPTRVWDSTLPSIETPYPMLVLVGPQGSGKKDLAMKLVEEFSDYFGYGISHTTRKPHKEEIAGKDYHFVTEDKFEMDIKMGQFLQTYQYHGHWYGLQMESIEAVAREGLACVVHMEIEGVLTLKNTYFEPRYVLVMPLSEDSHEKRLRDRGIYSEAQIDYTLQRGDMYRKHNQDHPGFFDMMINSDDIQDAYKRVRRLVMDYLGIGMSSPSNSDNREMMSENPDTTDQNMTTQLGTRTWSKPSLSESVNQPFTRTRTLQSSPILSGRGIVEEQSLKRRQSAAKEAVAGIVPPLFEQLLSNPRTAPQSVEGQTSLGEGGDYRSFSAPISKPVRPGSSDSSSVRSGASSSLSGLTSASAEMQRPQSGGNTARFAEDKGPQLPTETVNPLELMASEQKVKGQENKDLPEPRPLSNPRPGSQGGMRPGSDKHKVLPPISPSPTRPVELK